MCVHVCVLCMYVYVCACVCVCLCVCVRICASIGATTVMGDDRSTCIPTDKGILYQASALAGLHMLMITCIMDSLEA